MIYLIQSCVCKNLKKHQRNYVGTEIKPLKTEEHSDCMKGPIYWNTAVVTSLQETITHDELCGTISNFEDQIS